MNNHTVPRQPASLQYPLSNLSSQGGLSIPYALLSTRSGQNATALRKMLETQAFVCVSAPHIPAIAEAIQNNAALAVITEDVINTREDAQQLTDCLLNQPEWSDMPVILLLKGPRKSSECLTFWQNVAHRRSAVLLDMPLKPTVFTSVVQACLQNRQRQYVLRDTLYQLKESNQALESFSYTAAHELRNPLSAVTGALNLLERANLTDKHKKILDMGLRTAKTMNQTLQTLLDYGKLQAYEQTDFKAVNMNLVVRQATQSIQMVIDARQADVSWPSLPTVQGNEQLLIQLVSNLIKNAIVHNTQGPPEVCLSATPLDDKWEIHICDNGPGIASNNQQQIFDLFNRAGKSRAEGSGIGLALCRRIVEQHEGTLGVSSQLGKGSDFYFDLPKHIA